MLHLPLAGVLAAALSATVAPPFEGRATYELQDEESLGTAETTVWIGPDGVRTEVLMRSAELEKSGYRDGIRSVTLVLVTQPDRLYVLDERSRTYGPVDLHSQGRWQVEKLGHGRAGGRDCERGRIRGGEPGREEICVTRDLGTVALPAAPGRREPRSALAEELRKAGLDGLPIEWRAFGPEGKLRFAAVLRTARRDRVSPERLRIPPGWRTTRSLGPYGTAEEQRRAEEALRRAREKLTPDERIRLQHALDRFAGH